MVCTLLAGVNVVAFAADDNDLIVSVHSFYNDATKGGDGEHLYTKDADEMSWLSSLPTWNDEDEAWKAPVASTTEVYRCYNPASGEHLYVDEDYADYLAATGWNKEKLAFYSDDEMGVPVYRLWNGGEGVGCHHYTTDEGEVSYLVAQGWTAEDVAFFGVADLKAEVKLVSDGGLQSDGTALATDILSVVYGSDFGVPSSITWYKDGAVAGVFSGMTVNQGLDSNGLAGLKAGTYYVVIENTKGESYTTNTITVSEKEALAILSNVTLTEDYEHDDGQAAQNIVYNAETNKLVITVTVNRDDYTGAFALIPTEKVLSGDATAADVVAAAPVQSGTTFTEVAEKDFTDAEAIDDATYGVQLTHDDGSVTYKWCVDTTTADFTTFATLATLTRGTSYTLGFYHNGVSDLKDINTLAVGGFVDAPYVEAPLGIQIGDVTVAGANATISIGLIEMGETGLQKAEWMGNAAAIGGTLDLYGSKDNKISVDEYDDTASFPAMASKGAMQSVLPIPNASEYFMAVLTLDADIYGEEVVLESAVAEPAQDAAVGLKASYDPSADEFDPYAIVASVTTSFKAPGTVELYRNTSKTAWVGNEDLTDTTKATKIDEVEVKKGDSKVEFEDAVTQLYTQAGGNQYAVRFVPDDTASWKTVVANTDVTPMTGDVATVVELPAVLTFAKADVADASTGSSIKVTNQFGKEITGALNPAVAGMMLPTTGATMKIDSQTAGTNIVPVLTIGADKTITVTYDAGTQASVGDSYYYTLKNGQTVYATVKTLNGNIPDTWTVWIV